MDQAAGGVPTQMIESAASAVRVETQTVQAPHNAVKAEALSVFAGSRCLLADAELKVAEQAQTVQVLSAAGEPRPQKSGTCYGLVGPNGCGKSTLLRLLSERQLPVPATWDVFLVSQHLPVPQGRTPIEEVLSAATRRTQLLSQQAALQEEVAGPAAEDMDFLLRAGRELEGLQAELCRWDGCEREVAEILAALGFLAEGDVHVQGSAPTVATPMGQLSGGWRMKIQLAKALWLRPRLLLLDEPTNHLDFHALRWLQGKLEEYPHTSIVVSHDVSFLHEVCREILWIKDCKLETLPRDMVTQEDLIRMQRRRPLRFHFAVPEGASAADHGLSLHGVEFGYGGSSGSGGGQPAPFRVEGDVRFSGRSRAVVLGRNGSGKSTFLKLCVGEEEPRRGEVDRTPELQVGYYSQLTEELDRHPRETAAGFLVKTCREALAAHAGSTRGARLRAALAARAAGAEEGEQRAAGAAAPEPSAAGARAAKALAQEKRLLEVARSTLSHFGFEGDVAVSVPVECLSGGQKACLKFAALSLKPCHILMLDEPTNHLDAEACEALAKGLSEFEGGVVAVTHDELLIYRLIHCNWSSSELLVCRSGCLRRLRNFGASCLDALKKEVRGAEAEEAAAAPRRCGAAQPAPAAAPSAAAGAAKPTRSAALPPWLARAPRKSEVVADKSEETAQCKPAKVEDVVVASSAPAVAVAVALPKTDSAEGARASTRRLAAIVERKKPALPVDSALHAPTPSRSAWARGRATEAEPAPRAQAQAPALAPEVAAAPVEAPDSWEDLTEDEVECEAAPVAPEEERPPEPAPAAEKCPAGELSEQTSAKSDISSTLPAAHADGAAEGGGRQSRLRKDLVNLNKAVAKWLRQEQRGEISRTEIMDRIRSSVVAQRLRAAHGSGFQEDRFVLEALERSAVAETARGKARVCERTA